MKWIVLVILVSIAACTIFTLATLENRKTAKQTHEPWAEAQTRAAQARRAETAGYKLLPATTERSSDPALMDEAINKFRATITPAPAGIPPEINALLPTTPRLPPHPALPDTIRKIAAPAIATTKTPYQILYTCQLPDDQRLLGDTTVYIKDNDLVIVTHFNTLDGDLRARTRDTTILLTIPAGAFTAGHTYTITLAARNESRQWTVLAN